MRTPKATIGPIVHDDGRTHPGGICVEVGKQLGLKYPALLCNLAAGRIPSSEGWRLEGSKPRKRKPKPQPPSYPIPHRLQFPDGTVILVGPDDLQYLLDCKYVRAFAKKNRIDPYQLEALISGAVPSIPGRTLLKHGHWKVYNTDRWKQKYPPIQI